MKHNIFLLTLLFSFLLTGCKPDKPHKPLVGGRYKSEKAVSSPTSSDNTDSSPEASAATVKTLLPAPLTDRKEQILHREAYTLSYNRDLRLPNWVQWTLTGDHVDGPHKRKGQQFHEDTDVPAPRATHYDYMRSGYDRGHMCPSGDNKWSSQAQNESFLLTNICPQNHNLNTGDWNDLEMLCRTWAKRYGKIYIVCGPVLYDQKHKTIGRSRITVPEAFFKVVLRLDDEPAAIAFIYRNKGGNRPAGDYVNTLQEAERITKIHFFNDLDPTIREKIATHADLNEW